VLLFWYELPFPQMFRPLPRVSPSAFDTAFMSRAVPLAPGSLSDLPSSPSSDLPSQFFQEDVALGNRHDT